MKRYMLFTFESYYPSGGFNDFKLRFDTYEEIEGWVEKTNSFDMHWHLFDLETNILVKYQLFDYNDDDEIDDDYYEFKDEDKRRCYKILNDFFKDK